MLQDLVLELNLNLIQHSHSNNKERKCLYFYFSTFLKIKNILRLKDQVKLKSLIISLFKSVLNVFYKNPEIGNPDEENILENWSELPEQETWLEIRNKVPEQETLLENRIN